VTASAAAFAQPIRHRTDVAGQPRPNDPLMASGAQIVELADRQSIDLDNVLCWDRSSGRLWVDVTHRQSGRMGRIQATSHNALDVFNHPLAYGAWGSQR
jgi:hypothetical protein